MDPAATDAPVDRRLAAPDVHHGGRRIDDDPDLREAFERAYFTLSKQLHALRDHADFSQDDLAQAANMSPTTVQDIEKMRGDPRFSTVVRWAFVSGFQVEIRFKRSPRYTVSNPGFSTTSA